MEVDFNGTPTRPKMSNLVVASDKVHGVLGTADLDLSQFGKEDFQVHELPLRDCEYENAFVTVHLKGSEKRRQSTRNAQQPAANREEDG